YETIFFFQAEDGIRDRTVTGVQTCALPICGRRNERLLRWPLHGAAAGGGGAHAGGDHCPAVVVSGRGERVAGRFRGRQHYPGTRSEERRVGKECRYRRSASHEYKKQRDSRV